MKDLEEYKNFLDLYSLDLMDMYFDLNEYTRNNAFDLLNLNDTNKSNSFLDMIFKNIIISDNNDNDYESEEEFIYID